MQAVKENPQTGNPADSIDGSTERNDSGTQVVFTQPPPSNTGNVIQEQKKENVRPSAESTTSISGDDTYKTQSDPPTETNKDTSELARDVKASADYGVFCAAKPVGHVRHRHRHTASERRRK